MRAPSLSELNGYPVETIDNPAVNALSNSYQSALSHYLAGFVYEALGEPSLAAPGYRLANELQPDHPLLEEALRGLDARVARAGRRHDRCAVHHRHRHRARAAVTAVRAADVCQGRLSSSAAFVSGDQPPRRRRAGRAASVLENSALALDADHQHRRHGAPQPAGRHALHHAARDHPRHDRGGAPVPGTEDR